MRTYLDTSVLIALFLADTHTDRARRCISSGDEFLLSDFAAAEFSSAISGFHRIRRLDAAAAQRTFSDFDTWSARACRRVNLAPDDIRVGEQFMRRLDVALRTPDALHVAAASRLGASLATFDVGMAQAASRLNVSLVDA